MSFMRSVSLVLSLLATMAAQQAYASSCSRPVRIMPLGDSITAGVEDTGGGVYLDAQYRVGYRQTLYNSLIGSHAINFVGSQQDGAQASLEGPAFDFDHEGHPGIRDDQVAGSVHSWVKSAKPDYVLLHIGTNNLNDSPNDVENLLKEIDRYDTNIEVILARIITESHSETITLDHSVELDGVVYPAYSPVPKDVVVTLFNNNVETMLTTRSSDLVHVVDMESVLVYPNDFSDSLHPNKTGYGKMAPIWQVQLDSLITDRCSGDPVFISTPVVWVGLGSAYSYTADVTGEGPMTFSLDQSPANMSIEPSTGLISWTPAALGSSTVTVRATSNTLHTYSTQTFKVDVIDGFVVDNDESGTSSVGTWALAKSSDSFNNDSLIGKGTSAKYTFKANVSGIHDLAIWWTAHVNRATSVPVEVYDGTTLLDTQYFNQEKTGGQWIEMGEYKFSGEARVVINGVAGSQYSSADAVRFVVVEADVPVIGSTPVTSANVSETYTYDVDAVGTPAPEFSLAGTPPAGMSIDPETGIITWIPSVEGVYDISVEASNSAGSDFQDFQIDVIDPNADLGVELVIDNGDAQGFSRIGTWDTNATGYAGSSLLSNKSGASATFQASVTGFNEVSLYWLAGSNRANNVPVSIYDGDVLIDSFTIDQTVNGLQWNKIGEYHFETGAKVVLGVGGSWRTTSADAMRLRSADTSVPVIFSEPVLNAAVNNPYSYIVEAVADPAASYSINSGPSGMTIDSVTGEISWLPTVEGNFWVTVKAMNANGNDTQTFKITVINTSVPTITSIPAQDATVGVLYTYDVESDSTPAATYQLVSGPVGMVIDQVSGLISWTPTTAGTYSVTVNAINGNGFDEQIFSIDVAGPANEGSVLIIDDQNSAKVSMVGRWDSVIGGNSYEGESKLGRDAGGSFSFNSGVAGLYDVSLWWLAGSSRPNNVPVDIYDGTTLLETLYVNQQKNGGEWYALGQYSFDVEARIVLRTIGNWRTTSADAVRLEAVQTDKPSFVSDPVIQATLNAEYRYDADAIASAAITYQLVTAPAGMVINSSTGVITWTPSVAGFVPVTIRATNASGYDEQSFDLEVVDPHSGTVPVIVTDAVVVAQLGVLYSYDVDADGMPSPTYSLSSAPQGMVIDEVTGVIAWTPSSVGTVNVVVSASNVYGFEQQSFAITVTDPSDSGPVSSSIVVIDDQDTARVAMVGQWSLTQGGSNYETYSRLGSSVNGTFTFNAGLTGEQEISLWWLASSNRESKVPVYIYDGDVLLDTLTVDQRTNGGQWNVLGMYSFETGAKVVLGTGGSWRTTSADAVQFVSQQVEYVLDDADTAVAIATSGAWSSLSGGNVYSGSSRLESAAGSLFTFSAPAGAVGHFSVSLWWLEGSNRARYAPVKIYDGNVLIDSFTIDQRTNGGKWNEVGDYNFVTGARIQMGTEGNWRTTSADAVLLAPASN